MTTKAEIKQAYADVLWAIFEVNSGILTLDDVMLHELLRREQSGENQLADAVDIWRIAVLKWRATHKVCHCCGKTIHAKPIRDGLTGDRELARITAFDGPCPF